MTTSFESSCLVCQTPLTGALGAIGRLAGIRPSSLGSLRRRRGNSSHDRNTGGANTMTNYAMSPQHRRWVVGALLIVLMNQSYFLGGYVEPEQWDSLPSRLIFLCGGLALSYLTIELARYFSTSVSLWSGVRQLQASLLVAVPVLVAQALGLHTVAMSQGGSFL